MRQLYLDNVEGNEIYKTSFYSAAQGYVAFRDWLGYTTDSGRTFTKKYITTGNVNYGSYSVNLTFGFSIRGVAAFNQNTVIAYGDYGLVPAILYSTDGANSFTLIFHSQYDQFNLSSGIRDMVFPGNGSIGYAVDADRILKTTNQGLNWSVIRTDPGSYFDYLEAVDNTTLFALCTQYSTNKLLKTTNSGSSWQTVFYPSVTNGKMNYANFISANNGWLNMYDDNNHHYLYQTLNGGASWSLINNLEATPFSCSIMKFQDISTGYALTYQNTVSKTLNGGKTWEPLPRDNNYTYLGYTYNYLQCLTSSQLWAGGGHGFLEMSTNGGGTPIPKAYFNIDSTGVFGTSTVNLTNFSRTGYSYKWFLNDIQISTAYNASYLHNIFRLLDTVKLIVSNGSSTDTMIKTQAYPPPVTLSSFTPVIAGTGNTVTITGSNFDQVLSVKFGGIPATGFTVVSPASINAIVGSGASGTVTVTTSTGQGSLGGFTFLPSPTITSFSPASAIAGNIVTINGTNFNAASAVSFGGIPATTFTVVSPSVITAIVPSGTSGNITVTTPGGSASLAGFISLPALNSFTPLSGTQGTIITITGTSFSGTTAVTIGGIPVMSFTLNSSTSITAITGAGASGNVAVTTAAGTVSLPGFTWIAPPVITSFSPAAGPAGTIVTISGTGFNTTPSSNTIFFGGVKAIVTSGTSTALTVTVPAGATFEPITVTSNRLTAYSSYPFLLTFANGGSITSSSFASATTISTSTDNYFTNIKVADLDGDGKNDLIVSHYQNTPDSNGVLLYRNSGGNGTVSYENPVRLDSLDYIETASADFDGDGKLDLAVISGNSVVLFKNNSTPGLLSFAKTIILTAENAPKGITVSDVDGDGKPDIAVSHYPDAVTSIFRNTSEPGIISFAPRLNLDAMGASNLLLTDLDGDNKPEIIVPNFQFNSIQIFKNNSTPAYFSFGNGISILGFSSTYVAAGDIDGDGKTDLVYSNNSGSQIFIVKNISSGGTLAFEQAIMLSASNSPTGVHLADMDGDGKIDIVTTLSNYGLAVFKNNSSPGNMLISPNINFAPGTYDYNHLLAIADVNGDGKNDVITICQGTHQITIFKNEVKAEPFIQSFSPTIGGNGTIVTITGANFNNITAVSFGGIPASSFTINSANSITAAVGTGATGNVSVTNSLGTSVTPGFIFGTPPVIGTFSPVSGNVGSTVTISGNNFSNVPSANIVHFGGARAIVRTATSTSLTVIVPFGCMYNLINVEVGGLSTYSVTAFTTTFQGVTDSVYTTNHFSPRFALSSTKVDCIADMDDDGMLDIITGTGTALTISKNNGRTGTFSFMPPITVSSGTCGKPIAGDLDGDGKPDLAFISGNNSFSACRNIGTGAGFAFAAKTTYVINTTSTSPIQLDMNDLDGDGKADIAVVNYDNATISVFKNTSTVGSISFTTNLNYLFYSYPSQVLLYDLDGDKRPEMIVAGYGSQSFSIYPNTSVAGNISFANKLDFGDVNGFIATGDIDSDGKTDLIFINNGTISFFRNTSTAGNISFAAKIDFPSGNSTYSQKIATGDIDGDGRPDIIVSNYSLNTISLLKNKTIAGNVSFSVNTNFACGDYPSYNAVADMDNDGKADIVSSDAGLSIWRNQMGANGPVIVSFSPASAVAGDTVTIHGYNFNGVSTVSFGGVRASSFNLISNNIIEAIADTGSNGSIVVTTTNGIASLAGFVYSNQPRITAVSILTAGAGTGVVITGANFSGTLNVSFGSVAASAFTVNTGTSITAYPGTSGASGDITVTTARGTGVFPGFTFALPPTITNVSNMLGSGTGTVETITGTNFTGATSVSFGGYPAQTFTVNSATSISATVGYGTTGSVSITTPGGTALLNGFVFQGVPTFISFFPPSGTTGTKVSITGNNFGNISAVSFGGIAASSFSINSPTTVEAVVNTGASGNIAVTNPNSTASIAGFTYVSATTPAIHSFAPGIAGNGSVVTITGINFTGITAVNFGGIAASSFVVNSTEKITAVVAAATSGSVSVVSAGGTATLPGFIFTTAPVITSFTPASAPPGTVITIKGANFNPVAASNIVYFGTIKATIQSASNTTLVLKVPVSTPYAPITVFNGTLSGTSQKAFLPTFAGRAPLDESTYAFRIDSLVNGSSLKFADADIDGKPDLNIPGGAINFFRNTGNPGIINFAPKLSTPSVNGPLSVGYADFNNDGKLDIFSANGSDGNAVTIKQNNSSPGNITFISGPTITDGVGPFAAAAADFDGDGKADIAFRSGYGTGLLTSRNTSTAGSISFAAYTFFNAPETVNRFVISDIDNDGKPDIVTLNSYSITVARNTSTPGNITFALYNYVGYGNYNSRLIAGDIDGDGKTDLAFVTYPSSTIAIIRNKSVPGNIMLDPRIEFNTSMKNAAIELADADGDGRLDIITANGVENKISILINNGGVGNLSFAAKFDYPTNALVADVTAGDIDGDGKPEIGLIYGNNSISILKNQLGNVTVSPVCSNGVITLTSNISGSNYQWQQNTGAGYINITNGSNFSGTNTAILQISNTPSGWYGYRYRCLVNGNVSDLFGLATTNTWTGAVNNMWENTGNWSCGILPDANTDVIIYQGTIVISSNVTIRSLQTKAAVAITVNNGYNLVITH